MFGWVRERVQALTALRCRNMKVVLLGTGGYHPNEQRHTACVMLPELGIVLDAGTGFFRVGRWLQTATLDVFLSHTHLDHVFGLTFLFDVLAGKPCRRANVYGAADKLAAVQTCLLDERLFPVPLPCDYHALTGPVSLAEGGTLTPFELAHPGGSLGFRLDWPGHSMAYVTDTTARAGVSYLDAIRGVDLLLHECNFPDSQVAWAEHTGHSHTTPVAQLAAEAGVRRLVLIHLTTSSEDDDPIDIAVARTIFPATDLGRDGLELEF